MGSGAQERAAFSKRLAFALAAIGWEELSATQLAVEFNRRSGSSSITWQAVRKWMVGGAIPTQERLRILAHWLQVRPDWLRFGHESEGQNLAPSQPLDLLLLVDLASLDKHNKEIVREMINVLLRRCRKKHFSKLTDETA